MLRWPKRTCTRWPKLGFRLLRSPTRPPARSVIGAFSCGITQTLIWATLQPPTGLFSTTTRCHQACCKRTTTSQSSKSRETPSGCLKLRCPETLPHRRTRQTSCLWHCGHMGSAWSTRAARPEAWQTGRWRKASWQREPAQSSGTYTPRSYKATALRSLMVATSHSVCCTRVGTPD